MIRVAEAQLRFTIGRRSMSYNEIYSVMRLGGEKDLPKAIDVIISALKKDNWVTSETVSHSSFLRGITSKRICRRSRRND